MSQEFCPYGRHRPVHGVALGWTQGVGGAVCCDFHWKGQREPWAMMEPAGVSKLSDASFTYVTHNIRANMKDPADESLQLHAPA